MSEILSYIKKLWFVFVFIFLLWYFHYSHVMNVGKTLNSPEEVLEITSKAISKNKSDLTFKTSVKPDFLNDYQLILENAVKKDSFAGYDFFGFSYTYKPTSNGTYKVKMNLKKPRLYRKLHVKKRVKKVAKKFAGLSDYEKVKAVHDYIVIKNNYNLFEGGAYEALCKGHSACNGYALAFYAIMDELGVPVRFEVGANHMWNSVMLDGEWYNIDVTWDDPGDGRVHYDYFLKCDRDWAGHEHGSSTAEVSLPVEGRSAEEYYAMVPNYDAQDKVKVGAFVLVAIATIFIYASVSSKKEIERKKLQAELDERNRQMVSDFNSMGSILSDIDISSDDTPLKWNR